MKNHLKFNSFLMFFLMSMLCFNVVKAQGQQVTIDVKNVTLRNLFDVIEKQTTYRFSYKDIVLNNKNDITIKATKVEVSKVLNEVLYSKGLDYEIISPKMIVISKRKNQQEGNEKVKKISGIITDESGMPVIGANVMVVGTNTGTISDFEGKFVLDAPSSGKLKVSFIGYTDQNISIRGRSNIDIVLKEDAEILDEVVVVGYGSQRKRDVTGAVTRLDPKKMENLPNANVSQVLRGTVAGIQVTDGGRPGQDATIRIRGNSSISGSNDPLIVLDGIPYVGGSLSDINSNDIESIDILKDASSTAIYGSRATNGVILITTKKGSSSKPRINYNGYVGFSTFAKLPKLLGPEKYLQKIKDASEYLGGQLIELNPCEQANYEAGITIDPFEEISQDAPMMSHELSVSGKNDKVNYYFSGSYTDVKSVIRGDRFKRISVRSNFDINVNDWLNVGMNLGFTNKDNSGAQANLYFTTYLSPFARLYYEDGEPHPQPMDIGLVGNPLTKTLRQKNYDVSQILFSNIFANVKLPVNGLSYRLNLSNTIRNDENDNYSPSFIRDPFYSLGGGNKYHYNVHNLTLENILKYERYFNDIHKLDVTLMYGFEQMKDKSSYLSSSNIFNDALGYDNLEVGENQKAQSSAGESFAISSMARVGYSLKARYAINATIRRDGYSAFGDGKKYGIFPSIGFGWTLSEEEFMNSTSKWMDALKIRVSYGKNGNRGVSRYASLSKMAQNNYVFGDGSDSYIGLYPSQMANPNLGWESTFAWNAGIDFSFFSGRLSGALELYKMNTKDLLLSMALPEMTGYNSVMTNIGELSNRGFEATINTINIKKGDFTWGTNLVFSLNRNRIESLTGTDLDNDGKEDDVIANNWFIGHPLGANYDYVFDGIWQEGDDMSIDPSAKPGFIRFKDVNENGKIDPDDRQVLHSSEPDFIMGLTNTFTYKGLSLMFMFNWRQGGYSKNQWTNPGTNQFDKANILDLPYWTPDNPLEDRPSIGYPNPYNYGFYQSRTYLRLQDVSLSYDLPRKLISKINLNNVRVYVSGKNLLTFTGWDGWDPEYGLNGRGDQYNENNTPLMRSFTFGINIGL